MSGNGYNMSLLFHIGAEFVVATFLFIWTGKQVSSMVEKIDNVDSKLVQRMNKMEEQIKLQGVIIMEMENILSGRVNMPQERRIVVDNPMSPINPRTYQPNSIQSSIDNNENNKKYSGVKAELINTENKQEQIEDEEPDINVLDSILRNELSELSGSRRKIAKGKKKMKDSVPVEIILEEDSDPIIDLEFQEKSKPKKKL